MKEIVLALLASIAGQLWLLFALRFAQEAVCVFDRYSRPPAPLAQNEGGRLGTAAVDRWAALAPFRARLP
jgi:hypothetical protein